MVSAATALLLLDVTVVNVAVPAIGEDLGATFSEFESEWTALLPGLVVGGLGIGVISPALAAARVLPVDRAGLASGINNTFRQLGIAVGIAGLGAILQARVPSLTARADFVSALDTIFLVAAAVALAAVPAALLVRQASPSSTDSPAP